MICTLTLCLAASAAGQGQVRDFRHASGENPLLGMGNAALLATLSDKGFSEATLDFSKENGALISLEESPNSWRAGAGTSSYRRISDRIVLSGKLTYSYFRGLNMGGPVLMSPRTSAINFLEEDLSTVGTKKRETYSLEGGMSYSFNPRVSAGIKLDYTSADQTKFKDPRFLGTLMDLGVAPGVMVRCSDKFTIGTNLIYRHSIEQLSAGNFGTVERQYFMLVDQGGFFGGREEFVGDMGYVSLSNTRPMPDDRYGLSVQVSAGSGVTFAGEVTGLWRTGYYGSRTSTSVVFCEFHGPEARLKSYLSIPSGNNLHKLELGAGMHMLSNMTNSYTFKAEMGQATVIEYQGQKETLSRMDVDARLGYTLEMGVGGFRPKWILGASADAFMRNQTTTIYPDYRNHNVLNVAAALNAERNISIPSSNLGIVADVLFAMGGGNPADDGTYTGGTSKVKSFDLWLNRQFEFDTAMRAGASLSVVWTWLGFKKLAPYIKVSDSFLSLFAAPEYLDGRFRNVASVSMGCNF